MYGGAAPETNPEFLWGWNAVSYRASLLVTDEGEVMMWNGTDTQQIFRGPARAALSKESPDEQYVVPMLEQRGPRLPTMPLRVLTRKMKG